MNTGRRSESVFYRTLVTLLLVLSALSGCGGSDSESKSWKGSVYIQLKWIDPVSGAVSSNSSSDKCSDYGVASIKAVISASNGNYYFSSWDCSSTQNTVSGLPTGSAAVEVYAYDSGGATIWYGTSQAAVSEAGSSVDVTMEYCGSDISAPAISSVSPSAGSTQVPVTSVLEAVFSKPVASSTLTSSTFLLMKGLTQIVGTVGYDSAAHKATFTPSATLDYSTRYTATISSAVADAASRPLAEDYSWSFTTEDMPLHAPDAPSGVTAAAGDKQVVLNWTASGGAASYNVYYGTSSGFATSGGSRISGISSNSYTHTGLSNRTTYYYVVTAVNSNGESDASSEVSAMPEGEPYKLGGSIQGNPLYPDTNVVSTLAGDAESAITVPTDGVGASAYFGNPVGITTDGTYIYISDSDSIRKINPTSGEVITLKSGLGTLRGLTIDTNGSPLYVISDTPPYYYIYKVSPTDGTALTSNMTSFFSSPDGPYGITAESYYLYATSGADIVRIVRSTKTGNLSQSVNTLLSISGATLRGITTDGSHLYAADSANGKIYRVNPSDATYTTYDTGAALTSPDGITTDGTYLFITGSSAGAGRVYRLEISTGTLAEVAGSSVIGHQDGVGSSATFSSPTGITTDGLALYVADTSNREIRTISGTSAKASSASMKKNKPGAP